MAKKEAKKHKNGLVKKKIDKLGGIISKEVQKTVDQLQAVLADVTKQAEDIQKQVRKPLKKFVQDLETIRERELKRIQDEYQRVISELNALQEQLTDRLGLTRTKSSSAAAESVENIPSPTESVAAPQALKSAAQAPASSQPATTQAAPAKQSTPAKSGTSRAKGATKSTAAAKSTTTTKSSAASKATRTSKTAADGDDLTKLTGIGPAFSKRLREAGITSYRQIAEPSEADRAALQAFAKVRNFDKWATEAKALLADSQASDKK